LTEKKPKSDGVNRGPWKTPAHKQGKPPPPFNPVNNILRGLKAQPGDKPLTNKKIKAIMEQQ